MSLFIEDGATKKSGRSVAYLASGSLDVQVVNACSLEESAEECYQGKGQEKDKEMPWKRLRPPVLQTVAKSMYIGAWFNFTSLHLHRRRCICIAFLS